MQMLFLKVITQTNFTIHQITTYSKMISHCQPKYQSSIYNSCQRKLFHFSSATNKTCYFTQWSLESNISL